jgi:hypothetical protein
MGTRIRWNPNAGRDLARTAMGKVRQIAGTARCPVHNEPPNIGPLKPGGGFTISACCDEGVKAAKTAIAKELR